MNKYIVVALTLIACPVWADLQSDTIDRVNRLERDITLMQKQIYATGKEGTVIPPVSGDTSELYSQLEEQNKLITELTRKVEELSFEQDKLKEQMAKTNADIELRFQELEKSKVSSSKTSASKTSPSKSDKEAYDAAYQLVAKGKYAEAEKALTAFLKDYPQSTLAGNANYWLGETYYVRGDYSVAAGVFSDGLTKYENSTKAPDNLLKLGLTMAQLKKKTEACGFFKLLPEKFPKAQAKLKQRAKQESKKLSCPS